MNQIYNQLNVYAFSFFKLYTFFPVNSFVGFIYIYIYIYSTQSQPYDDPLINTYLSI